MTENPKQLSNSFSTGSGGANFETRIQAAFSVLLLTGRVAPCLPPWSITKLKLQGTYAGFKTDDFIVYTEDPQSRAEAKLLAQIKHEISITEKDETFSSVIQAAWSDFTDTSVFDPATDALALITGPLSKSDINNVRPLLEWARHSEDEIEFLNKVQTEHFSSDLKRKKLAAFKSHLTKANGEIEVSDKQLWQFLKAFHLLGYDLDAESGNTLSLIQSLIAQYSTDNPSSLWARIVDAVQLANQNAGTITLETLPQDIRAKFQTKDGSRWDSDLRKLNDHSEYIINGIRMSIGGVHIKRTKLFTELLGLIEGEKFVFISGGRGCTKSSLAREFLEYMKDRAPVFCLRTEDLDHPHLDNVFSSIGLVSSIQDVGANFALMPKRYLLIESIEKLLELRHSTAFTDLLHFLNKHPGWTVIATGRDYAYQQIVFSFLQPSALDHSPLIVGDFADDEIERLCREIEPLRIVAGNPSLRPLLKNPFLAELAYRVAQAGAQFSASDGEREFRQAVWDYAIAKEEERTNGMPLRRKQTFVDIAAARAREMVYGVSEGRFDSEALLRLEGDGLVRRDTSKALVSPAHDVLEDWALERYIEDAYRQTSGDTVGFLNALGPKPSINRAYRLWLHQKLRFGENVNELIFQILDSRQIPRYVQDETISAVLLGDNPDQFLQQLRDHLFENDGELLKRFCFVLRISCKTLDQDLTRQFTGNAQSTRELNTLFLMPYGRGWDAVIGFLFENRDGLSSSLGPHLVAVLTDWSSSITLERPLPPIAREAALLALFLLDRLKDSYRDEGNRKKLIGITLRTIAAIKSEFIELLNADVFKIGNERRRPYVQELCSIALGGIERGFVCKHIPNTVVKLALHEWLIDESKQEPYQGRGVPAVEQAEMFGLYEHGGAGGFFPPSGAKGPFQLLLRFHPRKGLDFILQLLNHTAQKYAHFDLDSRYGRASTSRGKESRIPQIEVPLGDGTSVKQYFSAQWWSAYRAHSQVPHLLESALMALENWLISFAETSDSQEDLEWVFDYILRNSNSIMPTAVLASVATGFPNKFGKAALPLLRTPELYDLDMARALQERGDEINWFRSGFQTDPLADIYAEERRVAALRPWRKKHLEDFVIQLQFSGLSNEALTAIDELRSKAPEGEVWRFRFHRIDSRDWQAESDQENALITFRPKELEPDLQEIRQRTQERVELHSRFSTLLLWADKILSRGTLEREYYADWPAALVETKDLFEIFKNASASALAGLYYGGIVKASAIFLRDHSSEMSEEDVQWCAEIVSQAVLANADTDDSVTNLDASDFAGSGAAASVLPLLLDFAEAEDSKLLTKQLIATALTHGNPNIQAGIANGIREHLWQADPEFAQRCFLGSIEYARLVVEISSLRREVYVLLSPSGEPPDPEIRAAMNGFRERLVGAFSFSSEEVDSLSFRTHSHWHLLNSCLMIPDGSTEKAHAALLSRMLTLFCEAEEEIRRRGVHDRVAENVSIHYKLGPTFSHRLAHHLITLHQLGSRLFIDQILEGCDRAPEFVYYLQLSVAVLAERAQQRELYWEFWKHLSEKVQGIAIEIARSQSEYRREDGPRKLIRGMLMADTDWQGTDIDYERQGLALGKELILEFANNAGKNADVFEAMTSLMFHFPEIFFEPAIHILARYQMEAGGCGLLSGVNSAFYLEGAIQRFLLIDEPGPLSQEMHHSCLVLLDAVVETASPRAYYLREQLIRSRRIL